ncbi:MAG TPA: hydantoinase/oxoprolinase family protein [Roseiarcus sp.]|jgi:N-methylhydantoinase A/oxoprolinase/acetone carboxylase beta subunit|nr:hydantoinase/oxoprolinase family protein [Roseiarcus sp.]
MGDRIAAWLAEAESPSSSPTGFDEHAVAVNLLFSYANGAHERAIAAYLGRRFPDLSVLLSSEVSPLWREYERANTTILDAFTRPMLRRFLIGLEQRLKDEGYAAPLSVMKSIIAIANENMANSIRALTVERGIDPRNFALVAFGGAGPLHGSEVAQILGIPQVIVPPDPGVASALGGLLTIPRVDAQRTYVRRGENVSVEELNSVLADLQRGARADLAAEGRAETPDIRAQAVPQSRSKCGLQWRLLWPCSQPSAVRQEIFVRCKFATATGIRAFA